MSNSFSQWLRDGGLPSEVNIHDSKNSDVKKDMQFPTSVPVGLTAFFVCVTMTLEYSWSERSVP